MLFAWCRLLVSRAPVTIPMVIALSHTFKCSSFFLIHFAQLKYMYVHIMPCTLLLLNNYNYIGLIRILLPLHNHIHTPTDLYPPRPLWVGASLNARSISMAKNIHKSQGDTLNEVVIDMTGKYVFPHAHYVALSRAKTLNGLHISDLNAN